MYLPHDTRGNDSLDNVVNTIKAHLVPFWLLRTTTEEETAICKQIENKAI